MNQFAPVLIPTLNRYEHFKRCVESLSACTHADKTDLFIFLDYPLTEKHWDGYRKIEKYVGDIRGFKSVNVIKRAKNYGAVKNLFDSISEMFKQYDTIILSEDDNEFSIDFLSFVNQGLEIYKERDDIFSISGYNYPVFIPENYRQDIYIWMGFSAWGVGIWKEKWAKVDFSERGGIKNVREFLINLNDVIKLNKIANHYIPALFHILKQNCLIADGYICRHQFLNKMYSVFPTLSRVRNIGHDGSGINCGFMKNDIYSSQEIYSGTGSYELPFDIQPNEEMNRILKAHFKRSFKSQSKTAAKLLLMKAGFYNPSK